MRKSKYISLFCGLFLAFGVYAQQANTDSTHVAAMPADTNVKIVSEPAVGRTISKVQEYQQLSHGTFSGYRIQIKFDQDRNSASQSKTEFSGKYPSIPSYLIYQQPYFKVCVGNFRTKLEAVRALNEIKKDYPGAFVVRDKINPPALQ